MKKPEITRAYVLASGPSIKYYKPEQNTTTYGVNDIFAYHPVNHLITLDNPWQIDPNEDNTATADRLEITKNSKPDYWHFWKTSNAEGIEDYHGFTYTPLTPYNGGNLFGPLCPYYEHSVFVATSLAARHGHKEIIIFGVDWYGHPKQEPYINQYLEIWSMLAKEMKENGINLYIGHESSALAKILPIFNPHQTQDDSF